jgi:hypothetical protein
MTKTKAGCYQAGDGRLTVYVRGTDLSIYEKHQKVMMMEMMNIPNCFGLLLLVVLNLQLAVMTVVH